MSLLAIEHAQNTELRLRGWALINPRDQELLLKTQELRGDLKVRAAGCTAGLKHFIFT